MNYLISPEAGCGHACELAKALKKLIPLQSFYFVPSGYGLDYIDQGIIGYSMPRKGEHLIVMTVYAYNEIVSRYGESYFDNFEKVTIIIPDGVFWDNPKYYNQKFKDFSVFATNCKIQYRENWPTKEYYQPFDMSSFSLKKYTRLTIAHSPFSKEKMVEKGTRKIYDLLIQLNADFKMITGLSWKKAMEIKAGCHIFIDQIGYDPKQTGFPKDWRGGIGKSGLEAMCLNSLCMSVGKIEGREIPPPPVVWFNGNFESEVYKYVANRTLRKEKTAEQFEWARKYCNPFYQAERIIR